VGLVAGVPFAYLRITRKNVIAPFAAHFALNLIETIFIIIGIGS